MGDVEDVVSRLTIAQREMLLRPPGRYEDNANDMLTLFNAEIWGSCLTPFGEQVRVHLESRK